MAFDYSEVTNQVLTLLEQGVAPWHRPWACVGSPLNLISKRKYHGINALLLAISDFSSPWWLTEKQVQRKGGKIRHGEEGKKVFFCKTLTTKEEKSGGEDRPDIYIFQRTYTVYNIEQCEGIAEPEPEFGHPVPENKPLEKAEKVVNDMPLRPRVIYRGEEAYYCPGEDYVQVPTLKAYESSGEFYSTLFHELAHSTGHKTRLNRKLSTRFGSEDYGKEELIAEITAAFLCAHCGIENTINNSSSYIHGWIEAIRGDSTLVVTAASAAQKAADYILNEQPYEGQAGTRGRHASNSRLSGGKGRNPKGERRRSGAEAV